MTDHTEKAIEAAIKVANGYMSLAHAGPVARAIVRAYEAAMCREPVAWRYKSEAPGGTSEWSITQFQTDLDTLRKMPLMRVEPLFTLPSLPEGGE